MKILVPGGCGYIGSYLIPHILGQGHEVIVLDPQWFGDGRLPENESLTLVKDYTPEVFKGVGAVVYLAGMTNDNECARLPEEALKWNCTKFGHFLSDMLDSTVKRFIFLSSVTVYGNTTEPAEEDFPFNPTTPYGLHKAACEAALQTILPERIKWLILRPAGVCGATPRMRFDLTINRMVWSAYREGVIHVHGGEQMRPHIHIRDLTDVILRLLAANLQNEVFNAVYKNESILDTAKLVSQITGARIEVSDRTDDRDYQVSGRKLIRTLSMKYRYDLKDAIKEVYSKLGGGYWPDREEKRYMNVVPL